MMPLIDALKNLGFTQQEAIIYIQLCKHGELTGYEAAKISGISRSNVYAALSSLTDKGYTYLIQGATAKYTAVPKQELLTNAKRSFSQTLSSIDEHLEYNASYLEPYITVTGENNISNKLHNIILNTTKRIYISCDMPILELIKDSLLHCIDQDLKVVILSPAPINSTKDFTYYEAAIHDSFKVIVDTEEVFAGTIKQALYSKNTTFVSLIKESFVNEIAVIEATANAQQQ